MSTTTPATRPRHAVQTTRRRAPIPPAVWLIAPSVVFMAALLGWPTISGLIQAFQVGDDYGTGNLQRMVDDPSFWKAVRNTLLLIVVLIPLQFVFALTMALLLNARPRGSGAYFYIWVIPLAVSDLAAGLVWLSIFTDRGYLNSLLAHLGLDGYAWLARDNPWSMFGAVLIAELWRATSLVLVIVVAGMQGIPKDYDEVAQVFGATYWQRLREVTLPLLKPSLQVALILRTILAFQTFAVAVALTGRNFPVMVGETYYWYSFKFEPHVATAIALVILLVSMLTSIVYLRTLRDPSRRQTGGAK
jgi:multiple sugar transport system permease protein